MVQLPGDGADRNACSQCFQNSLVIIPQELLFCAGCVRCQTQFIS